VIEVQAVRVKPAAAATGPVSAAGRGRNALTIGYLVAGVIVALGYMIVPRTGLVAEWVPEIAFYLGFGVCSAAAILVGIRRYHPRPALAWYLFAVGTSLVVAGDFVFVLIQRRVPSGSLPSVADLLYFASYLFMASGLGLIIRRRGPGSHRSSLIDALLLVTALGLLGWTLLVAPFARSHGVSPQATLLSMAYPIVDLLLLTAAVKLAVDGGRRTPAVWLVGASLLSVFATDTVFSILQISPGYHPGSTLDVGWIAWYGFWGAAALHPSMADLSEPAAVRDEQRRDEQRLGGVRLWLLAVALLVAPGLTAIQAIGGGPVDIPASVFGAVVLSLLVLARAAGLAEQIGRQASERKRLLERVVQASEEERVRVAADLHDGPIQRLTTLGYTVERVRLASNGDGADGGDSGDSGDGGKLLDGVEQGIFNEIGALRRVMSELRPPVLDDFGLPAALRDYAAGFQERCGVECIVLARPGMRLDPPLETVLYRVAQEALANVAKHAGARQAMVSLSVQDGVARLAVRDDGAGFDVSGVARKHDREHFGLASMRERVEMAGGSFQVRSRPGQGTTVTAVLSPR
jgi:signal transduction histidine kinase